MARPRRAIIWSPEARADLSDIWDYHAKLAGRQSADKIVRGISDASRLIEDHPLAGLARDEIRRGLRSIPVRPYIIFYRTRAGATEIVRVLHGRRDLDEIFADASTE